MAVCVSPTPATCRAALWRFDFSGAPPYSSQLLFEARDDAGRRQPITHAPRVVYAPGGGYLVLFGTGKLIEAADLAPSGFAPQSFYAVHDSAARRMVPVRGRGELARRTLSGSASFAITGDEFDYGAADGKKGWYFDFPQAGSDGEQLAASPCLPPAWCSSPPAFPVLIPAPHRLPAATRSMR